MGFFWQRLILAILPRLVAGITTNQTLGFPPDVEIPTTVTAGTSVQVTIPGSDLYNGDTSLVDSYRVYLGIGAAYGDLSLGESFFTAQCYLNYSISTCDPSITISANHVAFTNTTFSVNVPTSVGPPNSAAYSIRVYLFQTNFQIYGSEIWSNAFTLEGATGNFSIWQRNDLTLWSADGIPCTSFGCVKICADQAGLVSWTQTGPANSSDGGYRACVKQCPGHVDLDYGQHNSTSNTGTPDTTPSACTVTSASVSASAALGDWGVHSTTTTMSAHSPSPTKSSGGSRPSFSTPLSLGSIFVLLMNALARFS